MHRRVTKTGIFCVNGLHIQHQIILVLILRPNWAGVGAMNSMFQKLSDALLGGFLKIQLQCSVSLLTDVTHSFNMDIRCKVSINLFVKYLHLLWR